MSQDGAGTTVAFGTSAWAAKLIAVNGPGLGRGSIDATDMESEAMEYIPASLVEGGELSLTVEHAASSDPPIDEAAETITITWAGAGTPWSFSGFMTGYIPAATIGERMQADVTIKVTGAVTGI